MNLLEGFLCGFFGGCLPELLALHKLRYQEEKPAYLGHGFFWCVSFIMATFGGVWVIIYIISDVTLSPLTSVNLGASVPLMIGAIRSRTPHFDPGISD